MVANKKKKSVIRWAGGKMWMLDQIRHMMPIEFNNYHEPFVGGGTVFINLHCKNQIFISDINVELITFYNQVKTNLKGLINYLKTFNNTSEDYYRIRRLCPQLPEGMAARFYYLNRMCFNGLYRVNQKGVFNVPFGYRNIDLIENEGLQSLHTSLQNTNIMCQDFELSLKDIKANDLVFLDPPYTVAHNKNGFREYNQKIFLWEDQERLLVMVKEIIRKRAYFIMTNAYHNSIISLYKDIGNQYEIERYSTISGQMNSRVKISEIIITNCV